MPLTNPQLENSYHKVVSVIESCKTKEQLESASKMVDHIHQGMNALMSDFNHYQVKTDRKITELEKQLEIKTKQLERSQTKFKKDLPTDIRKVIGHIEFAKPLDK